MENICIHDNSINAYNVNIDNEKITFKTTSEANKNIDIIFNGVLAHRFENVINNNILLDIVEISVDSFVREYEQELINWLKYGFPSTIVNSNEELKQLLSEKEYKIFITEASLGLSGFIIAKSIELKN